VGAARAAAALRSAAEGLPSLLAPSVASAGCKLSAARRAGHAGRGWLLHGGQRGVLGIPRWAGVREQEHSAAGQRPTSRGAGPRAQRLSFCRAAGGRSAATLDTRGAAKWHLSVQTSPSGALSSLHPPVPTGATAAGLPQACGLREAAAAALPSERRRRSWERSSPPRGRATHAPSLVDFSAGSQSQSEAAVA